MRRRPLPSLEVIALILLNAIVFVRQDSLAMLPRILFEERWAAVPSLMWDGYRAFQQVGLTHDVLLAALPLVTASYLHADVGHIGGNMLFLWIAGNVVAQSVGRWLFLVLYFVSGVVAVLVYVHSNPTSEVPMLGASGAIAGLEGAYFTLILRWEVPHATVWPIDGPLPPVALGLVALCNFALDAGAFVGHSRDHVAYGAHVGGFLGGALAAMVIASFWSPEWREA